MSPRALARSRSVPRNRSRSKPLNTPVTSAACCCRNRCMALLLVDAQGHWRDSSAYHLGQCHFHPSLVAAEGRPKRIRVPTPWDLRKRSNQLVVDWSQIRLADRGVTEERNRGKLPLPMGALQAIADQLHLELRESARYEIRSRKAPQQPVEDRIRARVGDPEVSLVRLASYQIGRRRLVDDLLGHTQVARQRPDLRLEQVT